MTTGSINFPEDVDKSDIKDQYIAALAVLNDGITQWPTLTGTQKQTWISNNFDVILKILRAILILLGKLLA